MKRSSFLKLTLLAVCLVPTAALAHPGHADEGSVIHALEHWIGGVDPRLAVVLAIIGIAMTIGVVARTFGKRV